MYFALDTSIDFKSLPNIQKFKPYFETNAVKKKHVHFYKISSQDETTLNSIKTWIREELWTNEISSGWRESDLSLKAAFFDMDATILEEETLVSMAQSFGCEKEIAHITALAMNGKLDFKEALRKRLELLKGMEYSHLQKIVSKSHVRPGAKNLLDSLKEEKIECFLLSGGFKEFTLDLKKKLGFKNHFSNELLFSRNLFSGKLKNSVIIDAKEKANIVKKISTQKSISPYERLCVGDGANDIPMMELCGTRIGIFPKKTLQAHLNFALFKNNFDVLEDFLSPTLVTRCGWVNKDPLYQRYHDQEWGRPVYEDQKHFEFLVLESAQAGLSWITVLKKRENYRKHFANFDPKKVAKFNEAKILTILKDPGIIRNRAKIEAAIHNAQRFLEIQKEFGSFNNYCWQFVGGKPLLNHWKKLSQIPARTKESDAFAKDLKDRGFKFLGSTVIYAHMQAVGMVMDHLEECHSFEACKNLSLGLKNLH